MPRNPDFTITFSRPVKGVDETDLTLTKSSTISVILTQLSAVNPVNGYSATYTYTVYFGFVTMGAGE